MNEIKYKIMVTVSIVIAVLARVFNFGWYLVIAIVSLGGVLYLLLFRKSNLYLIKKFNELKFAKLLFYISCITLVLACIMIPDEGDTSDSYRAVFGLVRDGSILNILNSVGVILLIINLVTIILGLSINIVEFIMNKRKGIKE